MDHKIAFIDCESNVLESLKWLFKEESYQLYTFNNPLEALDKIEDEEFAIVVVDQHISQIAWINFLERVKERRPDTVFMIMTTLLDLETATKVIGRNDIHKIIFKPWDNNELKNIIKNAITHYDRYCRDSFILPP